MAKADPVEKEKRLRAVQEWIIDSWPSVDIIAQLTGPRYSLSERQAKRYIAEAKERWVLDSDDAIEVKRKMKIASLEKTKRSLGEMYKGTPAGIKAIVAVEKEIIKLEGLEAAMKVVHTGPNNGNIQIETTHKVLFENYAK